MRVDFDQKGDKLVVSVTIKGRSKARDPHTKLNTVEVLDIIKNNGYNVSDYNIDKEGFCSTEGKNPNLSSTWVFKRKVKNEKPATKSTRRRAKPTKIQEDKLLRTKDLGGVQSQTQTNLPGTDKKVSR